MPLLPSPTTTTPLTAIVTGASSGIGTAIAKTLLLEGYRIAAVGRDIIRLKEAFSDQTDDNVKFIIADLSTLEGCSYCISASLAALETSSLNLLVNNAGGGVLSQQWGSGFKVEAFDSKGYSVYGKSWASGDVPIRDLVHSNRFVFLIIFP